jgi:hypothetical protein
MYNYGNNPAVPALLKKQKLSLNGTISERKEYNNVFLDSGEIKVIATKQDNDKSLYCTFPLNDRDFFRISYYLTTQTLSYKDNDFDMEVNSQYSNRSIGLNYSRELNNKFQLGLTIENRNYTSNEKLQFGTSKFYWDDYIYPSYYVYTLGFIYGLNEKNYFAFAHTNTAPQKIDFTSNLNGDEDYYDQLFIPATSLSFLTKIFTDQEISLGWIYNHGIAFDSSNDLHYTYYPFTTFSLAYEKIISENFSCQIFGMQNSYCSRVEVDGNRYTSNDLRYWGVNFIYNIKEHELVFGFKRTTNQAVTAKDLELADRIFLGYSYTFSSTTSTPVDIDASKEEEVLRTLQQETPKTELEEVLTPNPETNPPATGNIEATGNINTKIQKI